MTHGMRHWQFVNKSIDGGFHVCRYIVTVRQHLLVFVVVVVLRTAKQGSTAWTKAACGASVDRTGGVEEEAVLEGGGGEGGRAEAGEVAVLEGGEGEVVLEGGEGGGDEAGEEEGAEEGVRGEERGIPRQTEGMCLRRGEGTGTGRSCRW